MIDCIKINSLERGPEIRNLLDFEIKVNEKTGEEYVNRVKTAKNKGLLFFIPKNGVMKLKGSIHMYANGGEFNNDKMTYKRYLRVAEELEPFISPADKINSIEFGVNVITSFDPSILIKNLLSAKKNHIKKTVKPGYVFAEADFTQYAIKIYNKGIQQPTGEKILRIELKYKKMENLFPCGLKWSELGKEKTWLYLATVLKKKFADIVYYDPSINIIDVPEPDRSIIMKGHNPIYWENVSGAHASRERKKYQQLISKYGVIFHDLNELIAKEVTFLVSSDQDFESIVNKPLVNSDHISKVEENTFLVNSDMSLYSQSSPRQVCKVTGIDISCQKEGSSFLCTIGLQELRKNDPEGFERLRINRLSKRWYSASLEEQIREIAHSIRNEYYNKIHNAKRDIAKLYRHPALFDSWAFIREDKRRHV